MFIIKNASIKERRVDRYTIIDGSPGVCLEELTIELEFISSGNTSQIGSLQIIEEIMAKLQTICDEKAY